MLFCLIADRANHTVLPICMFTFKKHLNYISMDKSKTNMQTYRFRICCTNNYNFRHVCGGVNIPLSKL